MNYNLDKNINLPKIILESIDKNLLELSYAQINWINLFINISPDTFNNITKSINDIISDKQIKLQDIPKIIMLISTIYHSDSLKNELNNSDNIIILVKLTFECLIKNNIFYLPDVEKSIIDSLISTSFELLEFQFSNIEKETILCCNILKKII